MKNNMLYVICLCLSMAIISSHAYAQVDPQTIESVVGRLKNFVDGFFDDDVKSRLEDTQKTQLVEILGDTKNVIKTVSEANRFTTDVKQQTDLFKTSLLDLNKSLEKTFSLALLTTSADDSVSEWNLLNPFSYGGKIQTAITKSVVALGLVSLYQQLSVLKAQVLLKLNEESTAIKFQQEYAENIKHLRENSINPINSFLANTITRMDGDNVPPNADEFCNSDIEQFFAGRLKNFSLVWNSLTPKEIHAYSLWYCLNNLLSLDRDKEKEVYKDGPFVSNEGLKILSIFEVNNLKFYLKYLELLENGYKQDVEILRQNFRSVLKFFSTKDAKVSDLISAMPTSTVNGHIAMGDTYLKFDELTNAHIAYQKALELAQQQIKQGQNFQTLQHLADSYHKIGKIQGQLRENKTTSLGTYQKAVEAQQQALTVQQSVMNQTEIAEGYVKLADLQNELSDTQAAVNAVQKAIDLLLPLTERTDKANETPQYLLVRSYGVLAWVELFNHQPAKAVEAASKALKITPKEDWIVANLAHAHLLSDQYEKAEEIYRKYKDTLIKGGDGKSRPFHKAVSEDFKALREKGIVHPNMKKVEALLGIVESKPTNTVPPPPPANPEKKPWFKFW